MEEEEFYWTGEREEGEERGREREAQSPALLPACTQGPFPMGYSQPEEHWLGSEVGGFH